VPEEGQGPTPFGKPEHVQPPKVQRPWKSDNLTPTIESIRSASPAATRKSSDWPKIPSGKDSAEFTTCRHTSSYISRNTTASRAST